MAVHTVGRAVDVDHGTAEPPAAAGSGGIGERVGAGDDRVQRGGVLAGHRGVLDHPAQHGGHAEHVGRPVLGDRAQGIRRIEPVQQHERSAVAGDGDRRAQRTVGGRQRYEQQAAHRPRTAAQRPDVRRAAAGHGVVRVGDHLRLGL